MEKIRVDLLPAASRSAMTVPNRGSTAVDTVVVGNLFPRFHVAQREYQPAPIHRFHVAIGIAGMVYMALGRPHQHNLPSSEVIAMAGIFARRKQLRSVYDTGVVDFKQPFAFAERPLGKNTKSIDGRVLHPDAAEFYAHFWTFLHERLVLSLGAGASAVNPSRLIGHCLKAAAPQVTGSCSGP